MQTRKELAGKMHAGNNNAVDHANGGSEGEDNRGGNNNGVRVSPRPLTESSEVIRLTLMHCDRNGTRSRTFFVVSSTVWPARSFRHFQQTHRHGSTGETAVVWSSLALSLIHI